MNIRPIVTCLMLVLSLLAQPTYAVSLLVLKHSNFGLYVVDTANINNLQFIGSVAGPSDLSELVAASGLHFYSIDRSQNSLYTVDRSDASVIATVSLDIDVPTHPRGWAMSPGGTLFAVLPGQILGTIDPTTGITSEISAITGASVIEGIAFAPDGTLYAVGAIGNAPVLSSPFPPSQVLFTINTITGATTEIATVTTVTEFDSLTYASDGFLYSANSTNTLAISTIWRIDPQTGAGVSLGSPGAGGLLTMNGIEAFEPVSMVNIDIKPGNDKACNGAIPVAILGSDTLDVIQVDQTTLSFEGSGVRERGNGALSCTIVDANSDGYDDLVCRYEDTTTEGTITGELLNGISIEGADTFCVVH